MVLTFQILLLKELISHLQLHFVLLYFLIFLSEILQILVLLLYFQQKHCYVLKSKLFEIVCIGKENKILLRLALVFTLDDKKALKAFCESSL